MPWKKSWRESLRSTFPGDVRWRAPILKKMRVRFGSKAVVTIPTSRQEQMWATVIRVATRELAA
jgi:hypothetical protein